MLLKDLYEPYEPFDVCLQLQGMAGLGTSHGIGCSSEVAQVICMVWLSSVYILDILDDISHPNLFIDYSSYSCRSLKLN